MIQRQIQKKVNETLPTVLRDELVEYYQKKIETKEKELQTLAFKFAVSMKEEDRSNCLMLNGEIQALKDSLRLFK